jgi:hypothetical protein
VAFVPGLEFSGYVHTTVTKKLTVCFMPFVVRRCHTRIFDALMCLVVRRRYTVMLY